MDNQTVRYCFPDNNLSCTKSIRPEAENIVVVRFRFSNISVHCVSELVGDCLHLTLQAAPHSDQCADPLSGRG